MASKESNGMVTAFFCAKLCSINCLSTFWPTLENTTDPDKYFPLKVLSQPEHP